MKALLGFVVVGFAVIGLGVTVIGIVLLVAMSRFSEPELFKDVRALRDERWFSKGWFPEYFPEDSKDIVIWRDLDSNQLVAHFQLDATPSMPSSDCLKLDTSNGDTYICAHRRSIALFSFDSGKATYELVPTHAVDL